MVLHDLHDLHDPKRGFMERGRFGRENGKNGTLALRFDPSDRSNVHIWDRD
jgi:hypothetical protein